MENGGAWHPRGAGSQPRQLGAIACHERSNALTRWWYYDFRGNYSSLVLVYRTNGDKAAALIKWLPGRRGVEQNAALAKLFLEKVHQLPSNALPLRLRRYDDHAERAVITAKSPTQASANYLAVTLSDETRAKAIDKSPVFQPVRPAHFL
jgi:hypothetical protein